MSTVIRPYEMRDLDGLVNVVGIALQTEGLRGHYPTGWTIDQSKSEFLIDPLTGLITTSGIDPLLLVADEAGRVDGALAAQSFESFLERDVPNLADDLRLIIPSDSAFYQRHIALDPLSRDKTGALRLFRTMRDYAIKKGYDSLVVGVPVRNQRGLEFMKVAGYKEVYRENNDAKVLLVFLSQELC